MSIVLKYNTKLEAQIREYYYNLKEVQKYFYSIKHMNERRDFYNEYIYYGNIFINFCKIDNYMDILDNTIFNFSRYSTNIKLNVNDDNNIIKSLHPLGFKLLNINIPFDFDSLKKAYKIAARKYHPDLGGNEELMKALNEAYDIYHNYLLISTFTDNNEENVDLYKFKEENSKNFYLNLFLDLIIIYTDSWDIYKAKELLDFLINKNFFQVKIQNYYSLVVCLLDLISELSKKFTRINKYDISKQLYDQFLFYKKTLKYQGVDEHFGNIEKIINKKQTYRILINHINQAENAFKINAITENKYNEYIKKFKLRENIIQNYDKILDKYLINNKFTKVPFDSNIKFGLMKKYILEIDYFHSKIVYDLPLQQQYEYYYTFYIKPKVKLIKKYLYVRLCSYILSLDNYDKKNIYINDIITECTLFEKFYSKEFREDKNTKLFIKNFIDDLFKLKNLSTTNYNCIYNDLKQYYYKKLPIYIWSTETNQVDINTFYESDKKNDEKSRLK